MRVRTLRSRLDVPTTGGGRVSLPPGTRIMIGLGEERESDTCGAHALSDVDWRISFTTITLFAGGVFHTIQHVRTASWGMTASQALEMFMFPAGRE